ncbi:50S ribosomal protein L19 [Microgenomates group bacterium]|nr:50S ribosomal protein L19 [Microgenomates group bacterium]
MSQYLTYQDTNLSVGDTIAVSQEIQEGSKKRVQVFEGILIAIQNRETNKTFTVRKIGAGGIGVEKIFPVNMPTIKKITVKRRGAVRRAKLYYLRDKIGRSASRIKEKNTLEKAEKKA